MAVSTDPQITLDEVVIEDVDLEATLEERQAAKDAAGAARKVFVEADEVAKGRIHELDLGRKVGRCGRFVITEREVAGGMVAYETNPRTRLSIGLLPES